MLNGIMNSFMLNFAWTVECLLALRSGGLVFKNISKSAASYSSTGA